MDNRRIALGIAGFLLIFAVSYAVYSIVVVSDTSSDLEDISESSGAASCETTLDSYAVVMEEGDSQEIPESCFEDGELITDKISSAEPGDEFTKTANGIE